jgi:EAL domain-containing protein (putative c-di-GMP-specific phosphodiesterase class I)
MLRQIGCHTGQGYFLGKPVDADAFVDMFVISA